MLLPPMQRLPRSPKAERRSKPWHEAIQSARRHSRGLAGPVSCGGPRQSGAGLSLDAAQRGVHGSRPHRRARGRCGAEPAMPGGDRGLPDCRTQVILAKPETFMNLSGASVAALVREFEADPIAGPAGDLRRAGSAAGNAEDQGARFACGAQRSPQHNRGLGNSGVAAAAYRRSGPESVPARKAGLPPAMAGAAAGEARITCLLAHAEGAI